MMRIEKSDISAYQSSNLTHPLEFPKESSLQFTFAVVIGLE